MTTITNWLDTNGDLHVVVTADISVDRSTATALAYIIANRVRAVEGKPEVTDLRGLPTTNLGEQIEYSFIDEGPS